MLGSDPRPRLRAGAGPVLGRRRLDLRDGPWHRDHGRGYRIARRRRQSSRKTVCPGARGLRLARSARHRGGAALLVTGFGALLLTGFMASERLVGF
jgi:hypothetical protein